MSSLDAKVTALINAAEPLPGADSVPDKGAVAPPSGSASGAESAAGESASVADSSPAAPGTPAAPTMADLFAEKLAKVRDQRASSTAIRDAKAQREAAARVAAEAAEDRKAAAAERARWEGLKDGSFLEGIKALGKDPAVAFAEMQREAIEAGTPEAQMKRMKAEMDRQLAEIVEPLKKTVAELTEREEAAKAHALDTRFHADFQQDVKHADYQELRIEYPDDRLLAHAKSFRDNPARFYELADEYKVRLTSPGQGFTMVDILNVLKSVQDRHRAGAESRRAALAPPPSEAAEQPASPTVNGTAARPKAGQTIGNDLTTARAADGKFVPKGATAAQRIRERARRFGGG